MKNATHTETIEPAAFETSYTREKRYASGDKGGSDAPPRRGGRALHGRCHGAIDPGAPARCPMMPLSDLIAAVVRDLKTAGLTAAAEGVEEADDRSRIRTLADLRGHAGGWADYLTPETRAALAEEEAPVAPAPATKVPPTPRPKLTNPQIITALRTMFGAPEHAFLEQVRSRTGFEGHIRTADAMAMGLWPSRGIHLHGFEIKVSRGDWMREKLDPAKAEEIARHVDRWWLVVGDESIVRDGELPEMWGLLAPDPSPRAAGALRIVKSAPMLQPGPMPRPFFAAMLRNVAAAKAGMVPRDEIEERVRKAYADGKEQGMREVAPVEHLQRKIAKLEKVLTDFEAASGVKMEPWALGDIGHAVRIVRNVDVRHALDAVDRCQKWMADAARDLGVQAKEARAELEKKGGAK